MASVAVQANQKIIFAGLFRAIAGFRTSLARVHHDGTPDTAFNPATGTVYRTTVQKDGKIITVGGNVLRLNPDGTRDASFDAGTRTGMGFIALLYRQMDKL